MTSSLSILVFVCSIEIVLRAMRALCYVLLHVLYHYNIQIVGAFQLFLSPLHPVLICVLDYVLMSACDCFIFPHIDDQL